MIQDIFIIGATGKVGGALVRQVLERKDSNPDIHKNPTRIVGLASKEGFLYVPSGISAEDALSFSAGTLPGTKLGSLGQQILSAVEGHSQEGRRLVFVDATALKDEMLSFHKKVIQETGFGMVTANKNPLAFSDFETFQLLTRDVSRYGFRCSVMAGAEAVNFLLDLRDLNDELQTVEGCFSGTLGYVITMLEAGGRLSSIVREASKLGYTEPNPADDLSGADVAKKTLILARSAGFKCDLSGVVVAPMVASQILSAKSKEELFANLGNVDNEFSERILAARGRGNVIRYVGSAKNNGGKISMAVGLMEVPQKSPLGSLHGTSNKIVAITKTYPQDAPYVVEAPGAGPEITAQNIRRDLLAQLQNRILK